VGRATLSGVSVTAYWMAAERARETVRPDRLFEDPLAARLAGPEGVELMEAMEEGFGPNPAFAVRTRFFDDALLRLAAGKRVGQIVLLAAGMDARAYRLDLPKVLEVDLPGLMEEKDARLAGARPPRRSERVAVAADLTGSWGDALLAARFQPNVPSVFVAEGLLGYLHAHEVHRLLDTVSGLAAPGSALLADVSGRSSIEHPATAPWLRRLAERGITGGRFGTDEPGELLSSHGWRATVSQYGDADASYGRWPYPPAPREDLSLPHNYLMVAQRLERPTPRPKRSPTSTPSRSERSDGGATGSGG